MSNKLNGLLTVTKTYWSIRNRFVNNRKIPTVPPLLKNGVIITNFSEKADLFNKFFAGHRTSLNILNKLLPLYLKTYKKCNPSINENDISTIISNLDPNKSH